MTLSVISSAFCTNSGLPFPFLLIPLTNISSHPEPIPKENSLISLLFPISSIFFKHSSVSNAAPSVKINILVGVLSFNKQFSKYFKGSINSVPPKSASNLFDISIALFIFSSVISTKLSKIFS